MKNNKQNTRSKKDETRNVHKRNRSTICSQEGQAIEPIWQGTSEGNCQVYVNNLTT